MMKYGTDTQEQPFGLASGGQRWWSSFVWNFEVPFGLYKTVLSPGINIKATPGDVGPNSHSLFLFFLV